MENSTEKKVLNYAYPPITEAVIELRIKNQIDKEKLAKVAQKLNKGHYPNLEQKNNVSFNLELADINPKVDKVDHEFGEYYLTSDDQTDIVILRPGGIVISRLAPYPGWDIFHEKTLSVWKIWKGIVKAQEITRIGIRYINRIDISIGESTQIDIEDFLSFYPKDCIFPEVPINDYFIQITKRTSNPLWSANIISTQHPPSLIKTISLLLDIDIFRTAEIPMKDAGLLLLLNEARDIKNEIFKQCITERTEEILN